MFRIALIRQVLVILNEQNPTARRAIGIIITNHNSNHNSKSAKRVINGSHAKPQKQQKHSHSNTTPSLNKESHKPTKQNIRSFDVKP